MWLWSITWHHAYTHFYELFTRILLTGMFYTVRGNWIVQRNLDNPVETHIARGKNVTWGNWNATVYQKHSVQFCASGFVVTVREKTHKCYLFAGQVSTYVWSHGCKQPKTHRNYVMSCYWETTNRKRCQKTCAVPWFSLLGITFGLFWPLQTRTSHKNPVV